MEVDHIKEEKSIQKFLTGWKAKHAPRLNDIQVADDLHGPIASLVVLGVQDLKTQLVSIKDLDVHKVAAVRATALYYFAHKLFSDATGQALTDSRLQELRSFLCTDCLPLFLPKCNKAAFYKNPSTTKQIRKRDIRFIFDEGLPRLLSLSMLGFYLELEFN